MTDSKKTDTTSVRLTDDDRAQFSEAMELEGIDKLATWIMRAARLHAKDVIQSNSPSVDIAAELAAVRAELDELRKHWKAAK